MKSANKLLILLDEKVSFPSLSGYDLNMCLSLRETFQWFLIFSASQNSAVDANQDNLINLSIQFNSLKTIRKQTHNLFLRCSPYHPVHTSSISWDELNGLK